MKRAAASPLPYWPSVMDTARAASYFELSEGSFRQLAARNHILPVELGMSVVRWRKQDLDDLIDRLPLRGHLDSASASASGLTEADLIRIALENVRRRRTG